MIPFASMGRFLLVLHLSVFAASAVAESTTEKSYWMCKNKKEVRTIRVHVNKDGVCSTIYSKMGSEKSVGSGRNHDSCIGFLNSIKGNLEKSNWNCRDISDTQITSLE